MQYGKYQFSCFFETEAELPPYKGSTFRGVFGIALKNWMRLPMAIPYLKYHQDFH
jgi:hypothetical protein